MYGNNYPNDYGSGNGKNVVDGTAKEVSTGNGNAGGQNDQGSAHNGSYRYGGNAGYESARYGNAVPSSQTGSHYGGGNGYGSGAGGENRYGNLYGSGNGYPAGDGKKGKKKKEGAGTAYWKKALVAVSMGLFFGICAGAGFFAVTTVTDALKGKGNAGQETMEAAESIPSGTEDGISGETQEAAGSIAKTTDNVPVPAGTEGAQAVIMDVSGVVDNVMPSIVSINNTYTQRMSYFGQMLESESTAAGSGIIVGESDTELLIVSNYHVIQDADKLVVQFVDGAEAEAQMKGSDPEMDLAVIAVPLDKVNADTKNAIAVAALGDSDSLTVGEPAVAIGNALGYGQSVTVGVISALDRIIDISSTGEIRTDTEDGAKFIQTDAAINPGNSGGALLNMKGEVIGINSNKIGGSAVEGMGYAIPISAAKPIIEDLMLRETRMKVSEDDKGYLGISPLTVVEQMTEDYGMPKGVYVSQVFEGTGAEAAGIVKGNIITEFDGNKINSSEDLLRVMEYYSVGDTVQVTVMYGSPDGWESKEVTVTLGRRTE